jgi:hypothetical protein
MTLRSRSIQSGLERHPRGTVDDRLRDALLCLLVDPHVRLSANPTQVTPIDVIKRRCIVRDMNLPRLRDPPLGLGCCDWLLLFGRSLNHRVARVEVARSRLGGEHLEGGVLALGSMPWSTKQPEGRRTEAGSSYTLGGHRVALVRVGPGDHASRR